MRYIVTLKGRTYEVEVEEGEAMILDEYEALSPTLDPSPVAAAPSPATPASAPAVAPSSAGATGHPVTAPLPGNVLSIKASVGDAVNEGDVLLIIEAMKMENEVVAPQAGTVAAINVSPGQMVETGDELMVI